MTEAEFEDFLQQCTDELRGKQARLEAEYGLGKMGRWKLDHHEGVLDFFDAQGSHRLRFPVVPLGTWASVPETWKWGWANSHIEAPLRDKAAVLKELAAITDYELFADAEPVAADEGMAWELAAVAVHHLQAIGCYRAPNRETFLFLALQAPLALA